MLQTARTLSSQSLRQWMVLHPQTSLSGPSSSPQSLHGLPGRRLPEPSLTQAAGVSTTPHPAAQQQHKSSSCDEGGHERVRPYEEIPTPKRFPILNFSRDFAKVAKDPFRVPNLIRERVEEFGKIYREKLSPGLPEFLFVLDPTDIEKVFRAEGKYPSRFPMTEWIEARKKINIPVGMLLLEGEEWHHQRIPVAKYMMVPRKVAEYHEGFNDTALDLIGAIEREKTQDTALLRDVPNTFFKWSMESVCLFVLGKRLGCLDEQLPSDCKALIDGLQDLLSTTQDLLFNLPLHRIWPTKKYKRMVESMRQVGEVSTAHIKEKMEEIKEEDKRLVARGDEVPTGVDFITYMVHKGNMNLQEITSNAVDLIGGGVDTTSYTLTWCLYSLATNPQVQERLRGEVERVVGSETIVTPSHIHSAPYLRDCIRETQRLYPIAPNNTRILKEEVILSGYRVPAGTQVIIPITVSGSLGDVYKDPERFQPERWSRDNKEAIPNPFSSLPFGYGPRMCVGRRVAELELHIALAQLIKRYRFEFREDRPMKYIQKLFLVPERQMDIAFVDLK